MGRSVAPRGLEVIADEEYERVLERVCAIDVAKASAMVCTRVPGGESARRTSRTWEVSATVHAVMDGIAAAAIGLTFATGLKLLPTGSMRVGPLAVTLATVLWVGILRWPMLPMVLSLAPVSIGLALTSPRAGR